LLHEALSNWQGGQSDFGMRVDIVSASARVVADDRRCAFAAVRAGRKRRMAKILALRRLAKVHLDTVHVRWYARRLRRQGGRFWRNASRKVFGQYNAPEVHDSRGILGNYSTFINTPSEGLGRLTGLSLFRFMLLPRGEPRIE
jgi:hypothetical protein